VTAATPSPATTALCSRSTTTSKASYANFFSLVEFNGDDSGDLPLSATYVIDANGTIRWAFLDADYTKRAEPGDVIAALRAIDG
jgi:peroxiredoxin